MSRKGGDYVNHDAHFYGAVFGFFFTLIFAPDHGQLFLQQLMQPHIISLFDSESGHYIESVTHKIIHDRDFLIVTTIPTQTADHIVIEGAPCVIETPEYKLHFSIEKKKEQLLPPPKRQVTGSSYYSCA